MKIYKYSVPDKESFTIFMPAGTKILSFQVQYEQPIIWASINELDDNLIGRKFKLIATGEKIENYINLHYIGTIQMYDGKLVVHLFEDLS